MPRVPVAARMVFVLLCALLVSRSASAQLSPAGILGAARDTSGGVLPGVTVEAASPALIEKVRTVVTDDQGRFNIVDLRPGAYTVTFTLPGFNVFKREGVELSSGFTATVNAEMRVGSLEETITVTAAAALVDTANVRQQTVMTAEALKTLPMGQASVVGLAALTLGLVAPPDVGGTQGTFYGQSGNSIGFHGKVGNARVQYNGMRIQNMSSGGSPGYAFNSETVEEMSVETGGMSAESSSTGVSMNLIPKEGGNSFKFGGLARYTNSHFQSGNLTDQLRARGVTSEQQVNFLYDYGISVGGPLKKDTLWFFTSIRRWGSENQVPGVFYNKTQGTMFYTPDLSRPSRQSEWNQSNAVRLTWQLTPKNKLNIFTDVTHNCVCIRLSSSAPESVALWHNFPEGIVQVSWSSPRTNKLLLEAGAAAVIHSWPNYLQPEVSPNDIAINDTGLGFSYNAPTAYGGHRWGNRFPVRASLSYVPGSHAFKFGMSNESAIKDEGSTSSGNEFISYTFNNGVPTRVTQYAYPYPDSPPERVKLGTRIDAPLRTVVRAMWDLGAYAQDQWTIRRLALNYGIRYDYYDVNIPAINLGPGRFVGRRELPRVEHAPRWRDWSPRLGASYDLFGTGRTALKMSIGRYLELTSGTFSSNIAPVTTSVTSANRSWTDANRDYVPNCDLTNFAANGECGAIDNQNFGKSNPLATRYADDVVLKGRTYTWDINTELQHQLGPAMSVTGGYYHNWDGNYRVTDNAAVADSDYSPYCITAPADPRLPGGGGYRVCGLYDINDNKFGQISNVVTQASNFGKYTRTADFFDASISTRFGPGIRLAGGVDTGRTVSDVCFNVDSPGATAGSLPGASASPVPHTGTTIDGRPTCRAVTPFGANTQVKVNGSYPLPMQFLVSGTLQNLPGVAYLATYAVPTAQVLPSLGRNLSGGTRTVNVPLISPQTQYERRRTQFDVRVSRIIQVGKTRVQANLDIYNALNASSVLDVNNTFGAQWRQPSRILDPRMVQLSARVEF